MIKACAVLLLILINFCGYSQNVFSPLDSLNRYDSSQPLGSPANPKAGLSGLQKWVATPTNGVSIGPGSWDNTGFKAYYLRLNGKSVAFRLKFPKSYLDSANSAKKYPLMLFFHGAGEPACAANGGLYNNEKHLLYAAKYFGDKVDKNDFDGFLLFPQIYTTNAGCFASTWSAEHYFPLIVNIIDSMEKYVHLDKNRITATGLSSGGIAAWKFSEFNPSIIASIAPSSAVGGINYDFNPVLHIPIWFATGELDNNPSLSTASAFYNKFKNFGSNIRHTVYMEKGHSIWNEHWSEPDFLPFLNSAHKSNPLVFFQKTAFCTDSTISAKLGISGNQYAYEWSRNDSLIASFENGHNLRIDSTYISLFSGNEITINSLGVYKVRFKRNAFSPWSEWSPQPVIISKKVSTPAPLINQRKLSSNILPDPSGNNTVPLYVSKGFINYEWRKLPDSTLVAADSVFHAPPGTYIARYAEPNGCGSNFSDSFNVIRLDSAESPLPVDSVTLDEIERTMVLNWKSSDSSVTGFEIYKSEGTDAFVLIEKFPAGTLTFTDQQIIQNRVYNYLIRAVNKESASFYNKIYSKKSSRDITPPTQPQHLLYMGGNDNSILVRWNSSSDNVGVDHYNIYLNGILKYNSRDTVLSIAGLEPDFNYNIKVCAVDAAGNTSMFSKEIAGRTHQQGLNYKYYEGIWNSIPDYNLLTPLKQGITDSISAGQDIRLKTENYSIIWSGYLYVPEDGEYKFELYSDDGSMLYIQNVSIGQDVPFINNDGLHAPQSRFGSKFLKKGYHRIAAAFFEKSGGEEMQLYWSSGSFTRQPVYKKLLSVDSVGILSNPIPGNDSFAPSVPGKPIIVDLSDSLAKVNWTRSADDDEVKGYELLINDSITINLIDSSYIISGLDTSKAYNVKVRSYDRSGNYSGFSAQTIFYPHNQGLVYKYYQGDWNQLPDFNALEPVKTGISSLIDLNTIPAKTPDNFGVLWKGYIFIPEDSWYTFQTTSDDGSKLYIGQDYSFDAPALINNDNLHGVVTVTDSIFLEKGYHKIAATFFEKGGGEFMEVKWKSAKDSTLNIIQPHYLSLKKLKVSEKLTAPDSIQIAENISGEIMISWMVNDSLYHGVELYRSSDSANFEFLKTVPAGIFSTIDSSVDQNVKYYYRLKSVSPLSESHEVNVSILTSRIISGPTTPENLVAVVATNLVQLSWDVDETKADSVLISRRNNLNGSFEIIAHLPASFNVLFDSTAGPGKREYYAVSKSDTVYSNPSDTISIITNNRKPGLTLSASSLYVKARSTGTIRITSADPDLDSISVSIFPNLSFSNLFRINQNTWEIRFEPERSDVGVYRIKLISSDPYFMDSTRFLDVYVSDDQVRTVFVNFGHSSIPAPKPWNNFAGILNANATSFNLRDDRNVQTGITIKSLSAFSQLTSLGFNTGNNGGIVPDTVLERGLRDPNASRQIQINGLNSSKKYNLHFISSVNEGAIGLNYYSCNDKRDTVSIAYNAFNSGSLNYLQPDINGRLLVTLGRIAGTKYIYLNGMMIEELGTDSVLNPNFARATLTDSKKIQITWVNRYSSFSVSDSIQVWRSEDSIFLNSVHLVSLKLNQDSFEDKLIDPGKKYWYKIRYKTIGGFSPYSNMFSVRMPNKSILINLNQNITGPSFQWNNLDATPASSISYPELKYDNGVYSGVIIQLKDKFNGENYAGVKTGNNSGIFPDDVLRSNYWLDKEQVASFIFKGLKQDKTYSIGFLSSISSNGWYPGNYTSTATVGQSKVYLNGWNNTSKIVFLNNLIPDLYGELTLELSTTKLAAYGFNTALVLYEYDNIDTEVASLKNPETFTTAVTDKMIVSDKPGIKIFPNPFKENITVSVNIERKDSPVIFRIYDLSGRIIFNKSFNAIQEGNNVFFLQNFKNLSAGNYILYCLVNGIVNSSVIIKMK